MAIVLFCADLFLYGYFCLSFIITCIIFCLAYISDAGFRLAVSGFQFLFTKTKSTPACTAERGSPTIEGDTQCPYVFV